MKFLLSMLLTVSLLSACGSKQEGADGTQTAQSEMTADGAQTGTSVGTVSSEIIGSDFGYIVENAKIVLDPASAAYTIKNVFSLAKGTSNVLMIRTRTQEGATELLALQFPTFADGTTMEYGAGESNAGFWLFGMKDKREILKPTGGVEGTIRLVRKEASTATLGLRRDVSDGVGEIEIVVVGIDPEGLDVPFQKKYAARFKLPMISLAELAKIDQPI